MPPHESDALEAALPTLAIASLGELRTREGVGGYRRIHVLTAEAEGAVDSALSCTAERLGSAAFLLLDDNMLRQTQIQDEHATRWLVLTVPTVTLGVHVNQVLALSGRVLAADTGIRATFVSFLRSLTPHIGGVSGEVALHVGDAVISLLTAAVLDSVRTSPVALANRVGLVMGIRRWIEGRIGDVDLTVPDIAREHHISASYLQKLFAAEGCSVTGWIRERRLELARRDLADPGQAHIKISVICAKWGFVSAAHFSRLFAKHFGMTPSQYRTAASNPRGYARDGNASPGG